MAPDTLTGWGPACRDLRSWIRRFGTDAAATAALIPRLHLIRLHGHVCPLHRRSGLCQPEWGALILATSSSESPRRVANLPRLTECAAGSHHQY